MILWKEMPEKAGKSSLSTSVSVSFADWKRPSIVLPVLTASLPGMLLAPHLGQIYADTFSTYKKGGSQGKETGRAGVKMGVTS